MDTDIEWIHLQYIITVYSLHTYKLHTTNTKSQMVPFLTAGYKY